MNRVVKAYMDGINWVLHYYFQGVSGPYASGGSVLRVMLTYTSPDPIVGMVLPVLLRPVRRRLQGHSKLRHCVHYGPTFQTV